MPRPVADGHLLARAEAWPFLSKTALSQATICLRRDEHGCLERETRAVAEDLERDLQRHAAGRSLDVLASLRDHAWFDGISHGDVTLGQHLCRLANALVEPQGDRVALRQDGDFAVRLERQRWLSLFLPSDLLIAARYASLDGMRPPTAHLSLCTPGLLSLLHEGLVSETHVHLGAAVPFDLLWTGLMDGLRCDSRDNIAPLKKKLTAFGDPKTSVLRLIAAAGTRLLLAQFLQADDRQSSGTFSQFATRAFPEIASHINMSMDVAAEERLLRQMVRSLLDGRLPDYLSLAALESAYRRLAGRPLRGRARTLEDVATRDPLSTWLPTGAGHASSETQFLLRAIRYIRHHGIDDEPFARVFWQYVRVRTILYKYLVQEPGTSGLDWFKQHYDRISPLRKPLEKVLFESGLTIAARDVRLGSFEGRTSPEPRWTKVRDMLRYAARQAAHFPYRSGAERAEVGLILHFLKSATHDGRPCAEPNQHAHGARFGAWFYQRRKEVIAIKTALDNDPRLLLLLRGVDVASSELSVPTWPLVPLFHRLREISHRVADNLAREEPALGVRPLRVTCHAGEDYRRLVEGLRRVHELLDTRIVGAGDRIGHGLALGHDPELWARGAEVTFQPLEDRLDDLLWEIERYTRGEIDTDASRLAAVSAEALRLGKQMFGTTISKSVEDLLEARKLRHDSDVLRRLAYPFIRLSSIAVAGAQPLLLGYLTDQAVYHRGRVPLPIRLTSGELTFLKRAQRWLRTEIAKREITIESNPSSNFLIGDMLTLGEHPSFRLQPLSGTTSDEMGPPLPLSVNSDDPVSFATSLADEHAHLYGALIRHGVGHAQALAWLEARRRDGHRSRFTLPASSVRKTMEKLARPPR
ncbi:MAG: hypothetical protein U0441_29140 [Polyangiaceae bacterium]